MSLSRPLQHAACALAFLLTACSVHAALPETRDFPAAGERLLLWVASERGRTEPELEAAQQLATRGVEVWSLDPLDAYFLPQLPASMERLPLPDLAGWLRAARAGGKRVAIYAVARGAVPVLRAAALLAPPDRAELCVLLMHPNLYATAEALSDPAYLEIGALDGLRVRVLQPRRSAAAPWLPGLVAHLAGSGAAVDAVILDNLREGYWARESPTPFEVAESRRMAERLLHELEDGACR